MAQLTNSVTQRIDENDRIYHEILRYNQYLLDSHAAKLTEAEDEIATAIAKRTELIKRWQQAQPKIDEARRILLQIERQRQRHIIEPRLDRLNRLKAEVRRLESEMQP